MWEKKSEGLIGNFLDHYMPYTINHVLERNHSLGNLVKMEILIQQVWSGE